MALNKNRKAPSEMFS